MIEINELLNIFIDLLSFSFLIIAGSKVKFQRFKIIILGVVFIILSHTATVVEGFLFHDFFNILEHLLLLAASTTLIIGISGVIFKGNDSDA